MFGFTTKVEDIEKWGKAKQVYKIVNALSNRDATVRAAAADALASGKWMDSNLHYTSKTELYSAVVPLLACLNDDNPRVIVNAAHALKFLSEDLLHPQTLESLITTMDSARDTDVREAAQKSVRGILCTINSSTTSEERGLAVIRRLSEPPQINSETAEALLYMLAEIYMPGASNDHRYQDKASPIEIALADFGPEAGKQMVRAAEDKEKSSHPSARAAAVRAFGERIVEGKECGSKHQFDDSCRCVRCGVIIHDLVGSCKCRRCGEEGLHAWDTGSNLHTCWRCGERRQEHVSW